MQPDVFISYSSKDQTVAETICAHLESGGLRCWISSRDIRGGDYWSDAIINAIEQSRSMVLIFSSNANQSREVRREIERAIAKELPIIPFRIDQSVPTAGMEYYMATLHWLDAATPPIQQHIERLHSSLRALLEAEQPIERDPVAIDAVEAAPSPAGATDTRRWLKIAGAAIVAISLLAAAMIPRNRPPSSTTPPAWLQLGTTMEPSGADPRGRNAADPNAPELKKEARAPDVQGTPEPAKRTELDIKLVGPERTSPLEVGPFRIGQSSSDVDQEIRRDLPSKPFTVERKGGKVSATKDPTFARDFVQELHIRRSHLLSTPTKLPPGRFYDIRTNQGVDGVADYDDELTLMFSGPDSKSTTYFIDRSIQFRPLLDFQPSRTETVQSITAKFGQPTFSGSCRSDASGRRRFLVYFYKGKKLISVDFPPVSDPTLPEQARFNQAHADVTKAGFSNLWFSTYCQLGVSTYSARRNFESLGIDEALIYWLIQGVNDDYLGTLRSTAMDIALYRSLTASDQQAVDKSYETRSTSSAVKAPI